MNFISLLIKLKNVKDYFKTTNFKGFRAVPDHIKYPDSINQIVRVPREQ